MRSNATVDVGLPQVWLPLPRVARILRKAGIPEGRTFAATARLASESKMIAKALDGEGHRNWWYRSDSVDRYVSRHGPVARRESSHATVGS